MALATAQAPKPEKRKGRLAGRPSLNRDFACNSVITDSATIIRRQRLARLGVFGFRADLLAALVWSDGGNDRLGGVI